MATSLRAGEKRQLGEHRCRWEDNIKIDLEGLS
jgi:hypothetical protein